MNLKNWCFSPARWSNLDAPSRNERGSSRWEERGPRDEKIEQELFSGQLSGINFDKYEEIPVEATGDDVPQPIGLVNRIIETSCYFFTVFRPQSPRMDRGQYQEGWVWQTNACSKVFHPRPSRRKRFDVMCSNWIWKNSSILGPTCEFHSSRWTRCCSSFRSQSRRP